MDEGIDRRKLLWFGVGAAALIFLCLMLCAFGALSMMLMRSSPTQGVVPYMQPPSGAEGGAVPPPVYNQVPPAMGHWAGYGPLGFLSAGVGLIFRLLFAGLLLLLFVGLARRLFWGHRRGRWHHWGMPPRGRGGKGRPHTAWGPWAWPCDREHWGSPAEPEAENDEPDEAYAPAE